ncbi:MAG TPA: hypothetical protein VN256_27720 [Pyrinomonadaceae bacterium]|nr:hypothetical protein [Pyrinomonadaceae bacterium]
MATTAGLAAFLLAPFLTGCSRAATEPPPKLSTWAEQFAAMESAVKAKTPDAELVAAAVSPVHRGPEPTAELVELRGHFWYVSPKSSGVGDDGKPLYPSRMIRYSDHHLAQMSVERDDEAAETIWPPPPGSGERARLIRISPQDLLRLTRAEGEAHMGEPVNRGNIYINLVRVNEHPPDVKAAAVWSIQYYGKGQMLKIWVDAQAGTVLKREKTETNQGPPEAAESPGP